MARGRRHDAKAAPAPTLAGRRAPDAHDAWIEELWVDPTVAAPRDRTLWTAPEVLTHPLDDPGWLPRNEHGKAADRRSGGCAPLGHGSSAADNDPRALDDGSRALTSRRRESGLVALLPRPTLFWRTFALIALLVAASLVTWFQITRFLGREVQATGFARDVVTVVNMTRSALEFVPEEQRAKLVEELALREDVDVLVAEPGDRIVHPAESMFITRIVRELARTLGGPVQAASRVNDLPGLWIGFSIGDARFWVRLTREEPGRHFDSAWLSVVGFSVLLALLGALLISRLVNRPLADLASSVDAIARGESPPPLAEGGPAEISELNRRFNVLARELQTNEAERALVLAGISHDIRTPLTRLRLEIEMSPLAAAEQRSMSDEIDRINAIVDQFIEFAQPPEETTETIDLAEDILQITRSYDRESNDGKLQVECQLEHPLPWSGSATVVHRILANLVENASKYGRSPDGITRVEIAARRRGRHIHIAVRDHGPGVPAWSLDWLYRPFARLDGERGPGGGTGLGLAVVSRLARRSGGELVLENAPDGGLVARIRLGDQRQPGDSRGGEARGGDGGPNSLLATRWPFR